MQEHPFAEFIRILGKGKRGSRSLTVQEAHDAMRMILDQQVEQCQLGAFLMLLRVKEETAEEIAGFVQAAREKFVLPKTLPKVDLDWSSYAGKRRQLPWFIFSALMLADHGIKVMMHGTEGHTEGRVYTRESLEMLGIAVSQSLTEAAEHVEKNGFAYVALEHFSPMMHEIINLRPLLGLRSPVHTVSRMLNPFHATYSIQGIFHPGYRDTHQGAAQLLGQEHLAVFKGEGGEVERNPDGTCLVKYVHGGEMSEEEWPAMFTTRHLKDETMDVARMARIWNGAEDDEYGVASAIGTTAIALKLMGRAQTIAEAQTQAESMWRNRNRMRVKSAA